MWLWVTITIRKPTAFSPCNQWIAPTLPKANFRLSGHLWPKLRKRVMAGYVIILMKTCRNCKRFKRTSRDPRGIAVQKNPSLSQRLDSQLWHGGVKTNQNKQRYRTGRLYTQTAQLKQITELVGHASFSSAQLTNREFPELSRWDGYLKLSSCKALRFRSNFETSFEVEEMIQPTTLERSLLCKNAFSLLCKTLLPYSVSKFGLSGWVQIWKSVLKYRAHPPPDLKIVGNQIHWNCPS